MDGNSQLAEASPPETPTPTTAPLPGAVHNPTANSHPPPTRKVPNRKPQGKVGHLPKEIRDRISVMLRNGCKQKDIITQLGADAQGITQRNISSWYHSPAYQLWLAEQEWREDLHVDQESASDLLNDFDSSKFNRATLQLAIARLYRAFRHAESGDLGQNLGGNAQAFARLVSALARACRETTHIQKFETLLAQIRQAKSAPSSSDPLQAIVTEWDKAFGHGQAQPTPTTNPGDNNRNGNAIHSESPTLNPQPAP
jgi:hypothetical protein